MHINMHWSGLSSEDGECGVYYIICSTVQDFVHQQTGKFTLSYARKSLPVVEAVQARRP